MLEGIDVSYAQPSIDWRKVAGEVEFVAIKATEGRDFVDPAFSAARVRQATAAMGRDRVAYYHFARADTPSPGDARNECRDFVKAVRARGGRLARNGVLDYERARIKHGGPGNDEQWIASFVDEYRHLTGERPWIYGGSVLRDEQIPTTFGCPLWLAAYVSNPDPYVPAPWRKRGWRIWQYTERGAVAGISGYVDRNKFNGDKSELSDALASSTAN